MVRLSDLPLELQHYIIFVVANSHLSPSSSYLDWRFRRNALRSLALVCKSWSEYATGLLDAHIHLWTQSSADAYLALPKPRTASARDLTLVREQFERGRPGVGARGEVEELLGRVEGLTSLTLDGFDEVRWGAIASLANLTRLSLHRVLLLGSDLTSTLHLTHLTITDIQTISASTPTRQAIISILNASSHPLTAFTLLHCRFGFAEIGGLTPVLDALLPSAPHLTHFGCDHPLFHEDVDVFTAIFRAASELTSVELLFHLEDRPPSSSPALAELWLYRTTSRPKTLHHHLTSTEPRRPSPVDNVRTVWSSPAFANLRRIVFHEPEHYRRNRLWENDAEFLSECGERGLEVDGWEEKERRSMLMWEERNAPLPARPSVPPL
ncbi:hypothetical protein MNV49_002362 [Pseudohyphozyma bogoriensis]|nr:hypothetical protein MNV49_002362 [Pseudohyphozyma bogoriensis]